MAAGWDIEDGRFGPRMVVRGPWSATTLDAARSCAIKELELNHAKGWVGEDLRFLSGLSDILESFTIIDFAINDVAYINDLALLRFLDVNTYCKTELRFSQLPRLEECSLEWRPKARSLYEHRALKRLFLNKWNDGSDLARFSGMTQLESLRLCSPTRLESLAGIDTLTRLNRLELALASRLTSLAGVEKLADMQCLEIHSCRKIGDISHVASLRRLGGLSIINCGDIKSIRPLRGLLKLEKVLFYESTNVIDGDLSPLKELPHLKQVAFMERPHYSLTRQDLPTS
jgi:hypothetical protein